MRPTALRELADRLAERASQRLPVLTAAVRKKLRPRWFLARDGAYDPDLPKKGNPLKPEA